MKDKIQPTEPATDHILVRRLKFGDFDAATQLYLRYAQKLRTLAQRECSPGLARHIGVEDIVQSAFGSFFRRAKDGHYEVPDGNELWNLLLVITLNKIRAKALHYQRAKRDIRKTTSNVPIDHVLQAGRSGDLAAHSLLKMVVDEAMAKFSPAERQFVCLRIDGYDVDQIAEKTGTPKRTVERRLQEFRELLGGVLQDDGPEEPEAKN